MKTGKPSFPANRGTAISLFLLVILSLLSLTTWALAVVLMDEVGERLLGLCAGLVVMMALFRSIRGKLSWPSSRIPLLLFVLAAPALAGSYFIGMLGGVSSSILILGLSIMWLGSPRFHRAVGLVSFVLEVSALLFIPADLILRSGNAELQIEPNPKCPLVRRLPRMKAFEDSNIGDLTWTLGNEAFAEKAFYRETTDRKGFSLVRGSSESRPYDVVLLGDSYTAHPLVGKWPDLVCSNTGLNVRNLAIPGTGPWEEYMNLRLEYPELKLAPGARVFWCLFSGNDLNDFYGPLPFESVPMAPFLPRLRTASQNFRRHSWARNGLEDIFTKDGNPNPQPNNVIPIDRPDAPRMLFLRHYVEQARKTQREIEALPGFPALDATIRSMADFVHANSLNLVVLVFPSKEEVYGWLAESSKVGDAWSTPALPTGFGNAVLGLCEKHDLPCHDLTPAFVEGSKSEFLAHGEALWQRDGTHWNGRGHQLTAKIVTDMLRSSK